MKCGIPQGSILAPLLFLIYINDLSDCLEYSSTPMFADDTTLTTSGKYFNEDEAALISDFDNVKEWLFANKLSLNLVKAEYLLIRSRPNIKNLLVELNIFVGDVPVNRVSVTIAVGVMLMNFFRGINILIIYLGKFHQELLRFKDFILL